MDEYLLQAMQNVVEDLYGHVHRVADLSCALGRRMDLPEEDIEALALVGILHDVGKVHIDPAILAKPGPLDDLERDHMRRHPELGYAMINERFDRRVSEAILYHHERTTVAATPSASPDSRSRCCRGSSWWLTPSTPSPTTGPTNRRCRSNSPSRRSPTTPEPSSTPVVVEAFMIVAERGKLPLSAAALRPLEVEAG